MIDWFARSVGWAGGVFLGRDDLSDKSICVWTMSSCEKHVVNAHWSVAFFRIRFVRLL